MEFEILIDWDMSRYCFIIELVAKIVELGTHAVARSKMIAHIRRQKNRNREEQTVVIICTEV